MLLDQARCWCSHQRERNLVWVHTRGNSTCQKRENNMWIGWQQMNPQRRDSRANRHTDVFSLTFMYWFFTAHYRDSVFIRNFWLGFIMWFMRKYHICHGCGYIRGTAEAFSWIRLSGILICAWWVRKTPLQMSTEYLQFGRARLTTLKRLRILSNSTF